MKYNGIKKTLVATTILGLGVGMAGAAMAEEHAAGSDVADVVVTARRTEERLQDVPVSVTVFNQQQLANRNITTPAELATYTPSLTANVRYGNDSSTFSIRGFTQEQRTTASVATYFGEVVTPRGLGGSSVTAGDGAGPGNLFDLQNVQVLNGPQGTLFGRNTTGGAVLLVPQKPRDEFGGYGEYSFGDYGLERYQAVLNIPFSPDARLRIGMDRQQRDGYLNNHSPIGPDTFNDVNYEAYRASFVADLTPNLENYTIATYSHSLTNGTLSRAIACDLYNSNAATGAISLARACSDINLDPATHRNDQDFYTVHNSLSDPHLSLNVWQAQNITTWDVNDHLTVKNIASYGEFQSFGRGDFYGSYFTQAPFSATHPGYFAVSGLSNDYDSSANKTYSEELQFSGRAISDRLSWQAGLYYEETDPQRFTGAVAQTYWQCANHPTSDPLTWTGCTTFGNGGTTATKATLNGGALHFQTQALYAQGDFAITDRLKLTAGYRYTWDRTDGESTQIGWTGPGNPANPNYGIITARVCAAAPNFLGTLPDCTMHLHNNTEAPTWVLGLNYQLNEDDMVYAKYSRGYRQGSINLFAPAAVQSFLPEELNAYEVGTKLGFHGRIPGTLDVALFYNDLSNAQLQTGFIINNRPTTGILSGDATTYGAEVYANFHLTHDLSLAVAYGYMNTNVDRTPDLSVLPGSAVPLTTYQQGQNLPYVPEDKWSVTATYNLPTPENVGDVSLSATWSYIGESVITPRNPDEFKNLNSYETLNLNFNWNHIFGTGVDGAVFATNVLDEQFNVYESGTLYALNYEVASAGPPRMIGARLRYSFGGEAH